MVIHRSGLPVHKIQTQLIPLCTGEMGFQRETAKIEQKGSGNFRGSSLETEHLFHRSRKLSIFVRFKSSKGGAVGRSREKTAAKLVKPGLPLFEKLIGVPSRRKQPPQNCTASIPNRVPSRQSVFRGGKTEK